MTKKYRGKTRSADLTEIKIVTQKPIFEKLANYLGELDSALGPDQKDSGDLVGQGDDNQNYKMRKSFSKLRGGLKEMGFVEPAGSNGDGGQDDVYPEDKVGVNQVQHEIPGTRVKKPKMKKSTMVENFFGGSKLSDKEHSQLARYYRKRDGEAYAAGDKTRSKTFNKIAMHHSSPDSHTLSRAEHEQAASVHRIAAHSPTDRALHTKAVKYHERQGALGENVNFERTKTIISRMI